MGAVGDIIGVIRSMGQVTVHSSPVDVLPEGVRPGDLSGWQDASATEMFEAAKSLLGYEMVDLAITTRWRFNGEFISQFRVTVDGYIDKTHDVDITVAIRSQTLSNSDGVAEIVLRGLCARQPSFLRKQSRLFSRHGHRERKRHELVVMYPSRIAQVVGQERRAIRKDMLWL